MNVSPHHRTARWFLAVFSAASVFATPAGSQQAYEPNPVLQTSDFVTADQIQGPDYRIDPTAPTDGFQAHFTIHTEAGDFVVVGSDILTVRIHEMAAARELAGMGRSEVFASSVKDEVVTTGESLKQAIEQPKETLAGVPAGVGRFFQRTAQAGKRGVQTLQDQQAAREQSGEDFDGDAARETAGHAANVTADALGLDEQRRKLAKQLAVDPYTTNEFLAAELDAVAQAAFAGSMGVRVAASFVPGALVISSTSRVSDWVWDTPPGDLRVEIDRRLVELGVPQETADRFLRDPSYTLTLQAELVDALNQMSGVEGRADVLPWALEAETPDQARFAVRSTRMLATHHRDTAPLVGIETPGPLAGRTAGGELQIVGAVDYLTWSERLGGFANRIDASESLSFWASGRVSPRARAELEARGWSVHEDRPVR